MSLRERVLRGGGYLVVRQALSVCLSIGGMILLTRLIGPENYGLYAGALALVLFTSNLGKMGLDVYLIRHEGDLDEDAYHQAFSVMLASALALTTLGLLVTPLLARWMGDEGYLTSLRVMFLAVPFMILYAPALARLERALDFKRVAGIELTGQLLFYVVALPLAWRGMALWAPLLGFCLWRSWVLASSYLLARYRPRWRWSKGMLRTMMGYGLGYSSSIWVWQLRLLANPLIVGRFLGAEGVGYVALAIRLVEVLSFVKNATWRLAISALAKVQRDPPRLKRALEEAMGMQLLGQGPLLAGFALVAPWMVPTVLGESWAPVVLVFPFIALGYMLNAVFNMHSSVLYVLQHNRSVTVFHVVHVVLFFGSALVLVGPFGIIGYGMAEVVALGAYPIIHLFVARLFAFDYRRAVPWLLAFAPPLFEPLIGLPWGLALWSTALGVLLLSAAAQAQIKEYYLYLRRVT